MTSSSRRSLASIPGPSSRGALSATLTYRGSGVVNFSVAAMAMYSSFIFYDCAERLALLPHRYRRSSSSTSATWPARQFRHSPSGRCSPSRSPSAGSWVCSSTCWCSVRAQGATAREGRRLNRLYSSCSRSSPSDSRIVRSQLPSTLLPAGNWTFGTIIVPENQGCSCSR